MELIMTNFAILNNENIVDNIVISDNADVLFGFFPDARILEVSDSTGAPFIGAPYDESAKKFIPIQPFASWIFNEEVWNWEAPVAYPQDDKVYSWDEGSTSWIEFTPPVEEPSV